MSAQQGQHPGFKSGFAGAAAASQPNQSGSQWHSGLRLSDAVVTRVFCNEWGLWLSVPGSCSCSCTIASSSIPWTSGRGWDTLAQLLRQLHSSCMLTACVPARRGTVQLWRQVSKGVSFSARGKTTAAHEVAADVLLKRPGQVAGHVFKSSVKPTLNLLLRMSLPSPALWFYTCHACRPDTTHGVYGAWCQNACTCWASMLWLRADLC